MSNRIESTSARAGGQRASLAAGERYVEYGEQTVNESSTAIAELAGSSMLVKYAAVIVTIYFVVGTAFFAWAEEWGWLESLYFVCVTTTTVGYGDLAPTTDGSKIFATGYILLGLSLVATCLGVVVGMISQKAEGAEEEGEPNYVGQLLKTAATVVVIITVGAVFVSYSEELSAVDSIYWAVVTMTSVGYGDISPTNESTQLFCIFYVLVGVSAGALSLGKFGSIFMEMELQATMRAFVKRGVTNKMIDEMDVDGNGDIDKLEFVQYMLVAMGKVDKKDVEMVVGLFDQFDADGSGSIDAADVRAANASKESGQAELGSLREALLSSKV